MVVLSQNDRWLKSFDMVIGGVGAGNGGNGLPNGVAMPAALAPGTHNNSSSGNHNNNNNNSLLNNAQATLSMSSAAVTCGAAAVQSGVACAMLTCRPNSYHFAERVLTLREPAKVGRSVAKARAADDNAVFDCKVLSRHHAVLWFENGRFYLKDTQSSNGTFVNDQRLPANEPHQIWSGDMVQFGVDVIENNKKVTHSCIVATLKLYLPNGQEARAAHEKSQNCVRVDELYKLHQIIQEASKREVCLESKLIALQKLVVDTRQAADESWQTYVGEERLLSRMANLETKLQQASKGMPEDKLREELQSLRENKIEYEVAAKERLNKLHVERVAALASATEEQQARISAEADAVYMKDQLERTQAELQVVAQKLSDEQKRLSDYCTQVETDNDDLQQQLMQTKQKIEQMSALLQELGRNMDGSLIINTNNYDNSETDDAKAKQMLFEARLDSERSGVKLAEPQINHINLLVAAANMEPANVIIAPEPDKVLHVVESQDQDQPAFNPTETTIDNNVSAIVADVRGQNEIGDSVKTDPADTSVIEPENPKYSSDEKILPPSSPSVPQPATQIAAVTSPTSELELHSSLSTPPLPSATVDDNTSAISTTTTFTEAALTTSDRERSGDDTDTDTDADDIISIGDSVSVAHSDSGDSLLSTSMDSVLTTIMRSSTKPLVSSDDDVETVVTNVLESTAAAPRTSSSIGAGDEGDDDAVDEEDGGGVFQRYGTITMRGQMRNLQADYQHQIAILEANVCAEAAQASQLQADLQVALKANSEQEVAMEALQDELHVVGLQYRQHCNEMQQMRDRFTQLQIDLNRAEGALAVALAAREGLHQQQTAPTTSTSTNIGDLKPTAPVASSILVSTPIDDSVGATVEEVDSGSDSDSAGIDTIGRGDGHNDSSAADAAAVAELEGVLVTLKERFAVVNDEKLQLAQQMRQLRAEYDALCSRQQNTLFLYIAPLLLAMCYLLVSWTFS